MFDKLLAKNMETFESEKTERDRREKERQEIITELNNLYRLSNAGNRQEDFDYIKKLADEGSVSTYFEPRLNSLKDKLETYFNDNTFNLSGFFKEYNYNTEGFTKVLERSTTPGQQMRTWFNHFICGNLNNSYQAIDGSTNFEKYKQKQNNFSSEEIRNNLLLMQANFLLLDNESKELICFNEMIGGKLEELENLIFKKPIPKLFDHILRLEKQITRASVICNATLPDDFNDRIKNILEVTNLLREVDELERISDYHTAQEKYSYLLDKFKKQKNVNFSLIKVNLEETIDMLREKIR